MASPVDICNRALSRLGANRILALSDNSDEAKACNSAWEHVRDEVLRSHPWNSVSARETLAPLGTDPIWGYDYHYLWPADCLRVLMVDTEYAWVVEGRSILTFAGDEIDIKYIKQETDTAQYDALLVAACAARMAVELCEELTQSNSKKEAARDWLKAVMKMARGTDGQESSGFVLEEDPWITDRE